ncbi:IclR family transcriptional regulator [Acidaminobacter hydrogenoformans]|uniref:Transcriptional regulator, IclR family n=1 Tax=Acidaminobacter hydrogenoformans DSM 2784 TaxID=1120920 RepID=A0A1G5RX93_9FIRM|nr:IclR family transcriptional regulator [Acidaminobacter hydrogenoformans]SCZ78663.1 transcriptional regulator, IclR family [Acidaminobacter hydrogenoformans DSM 2784]
MKNESTVKSIERALMILDCFTKQRPSLSLVEISKLIDMYPSTASRIISTLESMGYLKRNEKSLEYSLGYKLANLGSICLSGEDLRTIARPFLINLRNRYNESVGLYVVNKNQRVCIDCVPSTQPLHRVIDIGTRMSMTRGASGKLLLAYMPDSIIQTFLLEDPSLSLKQLEEIRQLGYSVSINEQEQNLTSIAAPIFNAEHEVISALFISGPSFRLSIEKIEEIAMKMKETAREISIMLGY